MTKAPLRGARPRNRGIPGGAGGGGNITLYMFEILFYGVRDRAGPALAAGPPARRLLALGARRAGALGGRGLANYVWLYALINIKY